MRGRRCFAGALTALLALALLLIGVVQASAERPATVPKLTVVPKVDISEVDADGAYCLRYDGADIEKTFAVGIIFGTLDGPSYRGGEAVEPGKTLTLCAPKDLDVPPADCSSFKLFLSYQVTGEPLPYPGPTFDLQRKGCQEPPPCVQDADTKQVGRYQVANGGFEIEITGRLPLCNEVVALPVTWQYANPPAAWPQINPQAAAAVRIKNPGKYQLNFLPGCGQRDAYAERGKVPVVPPRLDEPNKPPEPPFINRFFTGPDPYFQDRPASCVPAKKPSVVVEAAGCVNGTDGKATVAVTNPNPNSVTYTVTLGDKPSQSVTVKPSEKDTVEFTGLPVGEYTVVVKGADRTETQTSVTLVACVVTTTTPAVPPPVNQPPAVGLASTGASGVGAMAAGGGLLLALGSGLLFLRRRRNN